MLGYMGDITVVKEGWYVGPLYPNIFSVRRGKRALQRPISVSRRSSKLLLKPENREELKRLAVKIRFAIFISLRLILENPIVKQSRNASTNIH
jgi:hypothetical protein